MKKVVSGIIRALQDIRKDLRIYLTVMNYARKHGRV